MRYLLIVGMILLNSGCGILDIEHRDGELPKVDIKGAEKYCTETLKARVKSGAITFTCEIKL